MSSVIASVLRNRPTVVARLTFLLLLPWVWTSYFLPPWALSVCGGLSLIAFFAGLRSFVTPMFARRRSDDPKLSVDQVVKMRAGDAGKPGFDIRTIQGELGQFQRQLNIWGGPSNTSTSKTPDPPAPIAELFSQTEQAVLALAMSLRRITTKT